MSINRITGITSGMDTDSMIKDLMKIEKAKIDNTEKKQNIGRMGTRGIQRSYKWNESFSR